MLQRQTQERPYAGRIVLTGALAGQVEDGTPFGRWFAAGVAPLPSEGAAADQFRRASAMLRGAGYEHYEVSSYARPGKR